MKHKITYGASSNVCKIQLFVGSMQYLGDCLFLFYNCTFKFRWLSTKKMHAISAGRARIKIYSIILLKLPGNFCRHASNVSTWWNMIIFTVVWEKINTIGSAPTIFIHREIYSKSCRQYIHHIHKKKVFFLQFQLQ